MSDDLGRILREQPILEGLGEDHLALITGCTRNVVFRAGEVVFREGGNADTFYLIREGDVSLEVHSPARGSLVLASVHGGEMLGWSWLVPPHRWTSDARATSRTRALAIDGACLRGKCDESYELGYELLSRVVRVMALRLQDTRLRLLDLYGSSGPGGDDPGSAP